MEEEDDSAAMAQAMGFSSFGPPSKKRRYNPHSDASLPADLSSTTSNPVASASGANSAPLGSRTTNTEEIDLDDEGEDVDAAEKAPNQAEEASIGGIAGLPARPAVPIPSAASEAGPSKAHGKSHGGQGNGGRQGGRGQHNPLWYQGYFDPSSIANPWQRLEKKLGLEPRDAWPSPSQIVQPNTPSAETRSET